MRTIVASNMARIIILEADRHWSNRKQMLRGGMFAEANNLGKRLSFRRMARITLEGNPRHRGVPRGLLTAQVVELSLRPAPEIGAVNIGNAMKNWVKPGPWQSKRRRR